MASNDHGHSHGHCHEPLPTVVYCIVDQTALVPAAVHDRQAESYGFNNGQNWDVASKVETLDGDGRYLRWLQPMESDLAHQVEYDMDEQDQIWLEAVNGERRKDGQNPVSYEVFEIIFDKLEKEWFDLTKSIPKKAGAAPSEDSKCAICDDGECENSNAIVFCDGCNLAVHQDCYGVPYIPEGQWLCRKCTVSPDKPVTCVLCPNSYGAFKQTTTAQWAHLLCAIWVPDTGVSNTVYMEPIDGVENISKNRWKLICYLCRKRMGACIQCANRNCFTAFHVTCARERGLELKMKQGGERGELKAYCEKHSENFVQSHFSLGSPIGLQRSHKKGGSALHQQALKRSTSGLSIVLKNPALANKSSKSARAYKKTYSSGPPLIPAYIYNRVMEYVGKIKMAKKPLFVGLVCRYWSLKREARRGAPLLKRLHLEPWTASATSRHQTDVEKAKKLELIRLLRNDLEKVRMLTERVRKREKKKLSTVNLFKGILDEYVFSKDKLMRDVLLRVAALDKHKIFAYPVSRLQAPDYYDIIKHPMDWSTMHEKLDRHEYLTATDFQDDIELVINNARRYNKQETIVHKSAIRVREQAEPMMAELEYLDQPHSQINEQASQLTTLLTSEFIEQLFDFHYEPPPKKEKVESRSREGDGADDHSGTPVTPKGKKRTASGAGLVDGVRPSPRIRNSPYRGEIERLATTPVVSSRPNAREAARQRAEDALIKQVTDLNERPSLSERPLTRDRTRAQDSSAREAASTTAREKSPTRTPQQSLEIKSLAVDVVDNRSMFKLFESGWVLPEGSSRRRSAMGSLPSANGSSSTPKQLANAVSRRSRDVSELAASVRGSIQSNGELLTDADTSREKSTSLQGKAVKDLPGVNCDHAGTEGSPYKGMSVVARKLLEKQELKEWDMQVAKLESKVAIKTNKKLEDGTLVWAKSPGFPAFPAEVADPKAEGTPQSLIKARPANGDDLVLVMFFDDSRSGSWCNRKDLRLLGENAEMDKLLQSKYAWGKKRDSSKGKSRKHQIEQLVEAFNWAKGMAEIPVVM